MILPYTNSSSLITKAFSTSKRVYISADYSDKDGDRIVVELLHKWGNDNLHKVNYVDTAEVVSGSVSKDPDCRACDLKAEFNRQINASSAVIFIIGDKTADRKAGSSCQRCNSDETISCTPYKQNAKGAVTCKITGELVTPGEGENVGNINSYSYLEHEFRQAKQKGKTIIVVYNSLTRQPRWLPDYMSEYAASAHPFWKYNDMGEKVGDYDFIKQTLGYE